MSLKRNRQFKIRMTEQVYARTWKLATAMKKKYDKDSVAALYEDMILLALERMFRQQKKGGVDVLKEFSKK